MFKITGITHQDLNTATDEVKVYVTFEGVPEPQIMEFKKEDPSSVGLYNKLTHVVNNYPTQCYYDPSKKIFRVVSSDNLLSI